MEEKKIELVVNCGALGYDAKRLASLVGIPIEEAEKQLGDTESEMAKAYEKGRTMAEYLIDLKLFELAKTGDVKALDKLEQRKRQRK